MDGGKRTIAAARKVLELASVLRSRDQRTSTSEALEIANWRLYGKSTDSLHKVRDRSTILSCVGRLDANFSHAEPLIVH